MKSKQGHLYAPKGASIQTCTVCGVQRWNQHRGKPIYHYAHVTAGKGIYEVKGSNKEPPCKKGKL